MNILDGIQSDARQMTMNTNELAIKQIRLIAKNARLRAMLKRVEWSASIWEKHTNSDGIDEKLLIPACPICLKPSEREHLPDCELAALLKEK